MEKTAMQSPFMRTCSLLLALMLAASGCRTTTTVSLDALLSEGLRNEISAHETYTERDLRVVGTVEDRGLQRFTHTDVTVGPAVFGVVSGEVRRSGISYAYVLLVPTEASRGRLLCYFDPDHRADGWRA
jgi:hypothetical protein